MILSKLLRLSPSERRLMLGAALLLGAIRLGLQLLPFLTLRRQLAKITPAHSHQLEQVSVGKIVWAVEVLSRYIPGVKCLARALTTQVLLCRYGYQSDLRIGVARSEKGQLQAHAWVESQGRIVSGGLKDMRRYTPLPPLEGIQ